MRVGVDQAGQERHVAQIVGRRGRRAVTDAHDAAVRDVDPAAGQRRAIDRQHPSRANDHRASRALRPGALRAAYARRSAASPAAPSARAIASACIRGTSRSWNTGSPSTS